MTYINPMLTDVTDRPHSNNKIKFKEETYSKRLENLDI